MFAIPRAGPWWGSVCMSILSLGPVRRSNDSTPRPPTAMACSFSMACRAGRSRSICTFMAAPGSRRRPSPPDRDQVEFTYSLGPDPRDRAQPAPVRDEPIPPGLRERLTFVDLDRRGNDFLAEGPGGNGNDLDRLPRGIHKFGDVYFHIGERMVHVGGGMRLDLPRSVKGIPVQARADRAHFLHATQVGGDPGTLIGAYVLRYTDGTSERVPLVYGRNIANWWGFAREDAPTEAETPWTGSNDVMDLNPRLKIRLFAITWTNPHPEKEIAALDVLSSGKDCDPFLAAVTLSRR